MFRPYSTASVIDIKSITLTDAFGNSHTSLKGSLGQFMQADIECYVHWETIGADLTFYGNLIVRNDGGSWIADGFQLGDIIEVVNSPFDGSSSAALANIGTYQIIGIQADQIAVQDYIAGSGSGSAVVSPTTFTTEIGTIQYDIHGVTEITFMQLRYGIVANTDPVAYTSPIDGSQPLMTSDWPLVIGTSPLAATGSIQSWNASSTGTVEKFAPGTSGVSTGYEQPFTFTLFFIVTPTILQGWEDSNGDLDQNLVAIVTGTASPRFTYKIEGGFENGSIDHTTDGGNISAFLQQGSVGFYDEFRNGVTPPRSWPISNVVFRDSGGNIVTDLIANGTTDVRFTIDCSDLTPQTSWECILHKWELPDASDYSNTATTATVNFDHSFVGVTFDGTPASSGDLSSCSATISGTNVNVQMNVTLTDKPTLLYVDFGSPSGDDSLTQIIAYQTPQDYIFLPTNAFLEQGIKINDHSQTGTDRSFTDYKGWVEDGIRVYSATAIKKLIGVSDSVSQSLQNIRFRVVAAHNTDSTLNFDLEDVTLNIGDNTTRGFILPTGDEKNSQSLSFVISNATHNVYALSVGTKIRYESWLAQTNANVSEFPSANKNWSNYITSNYSVKIYIDWNCNNDITYQQHADVELLDYEEYPNCEVLGEIDTFHEPTMTDLSGSYSKTANTIVRATFTGKELFPCIYQDNGSCEFTQIESGSGSYSNDELSLEDCPEYYGILEIDPLPGNEFSIMQISTMYDVATGTPWIGHSGDRAKITLFPFANPPRIEVQAELDYTQLAASPGYKISARLGKIAETICRVSIMTRLTSSTTAYTNPALNGYAPKDLLFFSDYEYKNGDLLSLTAGTATFKSPLGRNLKICCSKDADTATITGGSFTDAGLIGLDIDQDFLFFDGLNEREVTTFTGTTFNSGTGTVTYAFGTANPCLISFHSTLVVDTLVSASTYTDTSFIGMTPQDVMVFCNGQEQTSGGNVSITGSTMTFGSALTGKLKVIKVNQ